MNQKPKYLLKYELKEIENNDLEEIMRLAKNLTVYYEIFRVYKSSDDRIKSVANMEEMKEVGRLFNKGYSRDIIVRQTGLTRFYVDKIIGKTGHNKSTTVQI